MKFGINTISTDESIRPAVLAKAVEDRGFDAFFLPEHSHIPASRQTPFPLGGDLPPVYYRMVDPCLALAAAATVTDTLLVGTSITLLPQRDVIATAKTVASLDLISGGRFVFGVGIGWNREEMRNHGTDPGTRGIRMDEQLRAMKEIWVSDEAEFHGTFVDFDPIFAWPKPVQRPHPPLYVGGNSAAALARAVAYADGWMPNALPDASQIKPQLENAAEVGGPSFQVTATSAMAEPAVIEAYADGGAELLSFILATGPEAETLRQLDGFTALVDGYR